MHYEIMNHIINQIPGFDWIHWIAFDEDAKFNRLTRVWLYEDKPVLRNTHWYSSTGRMSSCYINLPAINWRDSLIEIPSSKNRQSTIIREGKILSLKEEIHRLELRLADKKKTLREFMLADRKLKDIK